MFMYSSHSPRLSTLESASPRVPIRVRWDGGSPSWTPESPDSSENTLR